MAAAGTQDFEALLNELARVATSSGRKVSVEDVYCAIGERSFGPLLLVVGLLGMTPVSAVPSAPTVLAVVTILIAGQLLLGRRTLWLPSPLLRLSISADKVKRAVKIARKPAHAVDRLARPRLTFLTGRIADRLVALACVLVAACVPPLELLPFVAFVPAAAIAAFGLGLVTRDGLVVLLALLLSGGALGLIAWQLLR